MPNTLESRGDRRLGARFDVLGALWGVLELPEPARIVNVSSTGILIDAPSQAAVDSTQTIRLLVEGEMVSVEARVRHIRPAPRAGRFLIGLIFASVPTTVLASIEQLGSSHPVEVFRLGTRT